MSLLAIGLGNAILGSVAAVVALAGAVGAVALLTRVVQPALEIKRYAESILDAGLAIARNVDGVDELDRTRELATSLPGRASAYLDRR